MVEQTYVERVLNDPKRRRLVYQELTILNATERIHQVMKTQGVSRADLAVKLGTSKSHVSQLLDGTRNMTLRTLSDIFEALDQTVCVHSQGVDDPPGTVLPMPVPDWAPRRAAGFQWPEPRLKIAS